MKFLKLVVLACILIRFMLKVNNMEKQVCVVTGGSSGIGLAVVKKLLEENKYVVSISRDSARIASAEQSLKLFEGQYDFIQGDITSPNDIEALSLFLSRKFNSINALVNCAGIILPGGIEDCTLDSWKTVIDINLTGAFLVTKTLLPLLKTSPNDASIVNVSSICSTRGGSSLPYTASKSALDMFTKSLALELSKYKIRVNSVNPGAVITNLQLAGGVFCNDDEFNEYVLKMNQLHPLGRIGVAEEIASAVFFLLSDQSLWTTGAILNVDGGRSI